MRFATIAVSLVQWLINHQNQVSYCVKQPDGVLVNESKFLTALVTMQCVKLVVFSIWSIELTEPDWQRDSPEEDSFATTLTSSYQPNSVKSPKETKEKMLAPTST